MCQHRDGRLLATCSAARVADIFNAVESRGQLHEAQRYQIWDSALVMIANSPLVGTGMGSFFYNLIAQAEKYRTYSVLRVHNDVLELGVELSVIGWILLLGAVISLLLSLYKLITQSEMQQRLFYVSIAIALAGSTLNMQFSFPCQMPVPLMLFGLYAALIVKVSDNYNTKETLIKTGKCEISKFTKQLIAGNESDASNHPMDERFRKACEANQEGKVSVADGADYSLG